MAERLRQRHAAPCREQRAFTREPPPHAPRTKPHIASQMQPHAAPPRPMHASTEEEEAGCELIPLADVSASMAWRCHAQYREYANVRWADDMQQRQQLWASYTRAG